LLLSPGNGKADFSFRGFWRMRDLTKKEEVQLVTKKKAKGGERKE